MEWVKTNELLEDMAKYHWRDVKTKDRISVGSAFILIIRHGSYVEYLDESIPSLTIQQGLDIWMESAVKNSWFSGFPSEFRDYVKENAKEYFTSIGFPDIDKLK